MGGMSTSAAVITSTTPGAWRASEVSTDSTRAWAMVERTNVTQHAPSSGRSSRYFRPVVRKAGSSRRRTRLPRMLTRRTLGEPLGNRGCLCRRRRGMRRLLIATVGAVALVLAGTAPALACGGLVAPNGTVRLLRTSTLAAYTGGVEHYITSFTFVGGGAEVGSIVPLPGVPTSVERGGDWTLQRLQRETQPVFEAATASAGDARTTSAKAEVLLEKRIDALDLTVLRGGAAEVGTWAKEHGFALSPDAPEVLE